MSSGTKSSQPPIHDGFATIRSRGSLNRSRSRLERKPLKAEPIYDTVAGCLPSLPLNSTFKPEYDYLPPLKSPQYINDLHSFRSVDGSSRISLYQRPPSPSVATQPPKSPIYANWSSFKVPEDATFKKPPIAYHKSFSVRERPFVRDYGINLSSSDVSDISSTESYSKIHKNASAELIHLTDSGYIPNGGGPRVNHRYATLGHQPRKLAVGKSTGSLNECALLDHNDLLECKIGSQNTLRTKPKIPWYELAIKKENRQSCPPFPQVKPSKF